MEEGRGQAKEGRRIGIYIILFAARVVPGCLVEVRRNERRAEKNKRREEGGRKEHALPVHHLGVA